MPRLRWAASFVALLSGCQALRGAGPREDLTFQAVTRGPQKCHLCHQHFYEGFGFDACLLSGATAWSEKARPPLFLAKSHNSQFSKRSKVGMGSCSLQMPWDAVTLPSCSLPIPPGCPPRNVLNLSTFQPGEGEDVALTDVPTVAAGQHAK